MTPLTCLKADRDTCYILACAAYGQEFVNNLLWEGNDTNDMQMRDAIEDTRKFTKSFLVVDTGTSTGDPTRTPSHEYDVQLPDGLWGEEDYYGRYSSDYL